MGFGGRLFTQAQRLNPSAHGVGVNSTRAASWFAALLLPASLLRYRCHLIGSRQKTPSLLDPSMWAVRHRARPSWWPADTSNVGEMDPLPGAVETALRGRLDDQSGPIRAFAAGSRSLKSLGEATAAPGPRSTLELEPWSWVAAMWFGRSLGPHRAHRATFRARSESRPPSPGQAGCCKNAWRAGRCGTERRTAPSASGAGAPSSSRAGALARGRTSPRAGH